MTNSTRAFPLQGHVGGHIRRTTWNLLFWNALGIVAVAAICVGGRTYFYNFFCGPFNCDDNGLIELAQHPGGGTLLAYVSLGERKLYETGMTQTVNIGIGRGQPQTVRPIFVTRVADQWMLVLAHDNYIGPRLYGQIYETPPGIRSQVDGSLIGGSPVINGKILPIMLDDSVDFRFGGYFWLSLLVPIGGLCFFNLARGLVRFANPEFHPTARTLSQLGRSQTLAAQIDREVAHRPAERFGSNTFTRSWLLRRSKFGMTPIRFDEVVWFYEQIVPARNSAAPGRLGVIVLYTRDGTRTDLRIPTDRIASALQAVRERAPRAMDGFSDELDALWRKCPADVVAMSDRLRT